MLTLTPIKTAGAAEAHHAVQVMVLAFSSDPVLRWMYPDPDQYLFGFPAFVRAFAGAAFQTNTAYYVDGFVGAALWLPPGTHADEAALEDVVRRTVLEGTQDDLTAIFEQLDSYHPREEHWYLPLLGVDPAHQRRGYGSALMQHALARCDQDGWTAYLESSNWENVSLYQRHGFEIMGEIQAGSSPPLYPMIRQPR
jgi:ribosomal protein S18 acetylase RimI-like enzyme